MSNHANFLATDNSIYLIVVPLLEVGEGNSSFRVRTIAEMLERYLFWCRFIFSVIRKEQAFPHIARTDQHFQHRTDSERKYGIPMITLFNRFRRLCPDEKYDSHMQNAIPVLLRQLNNEFTISSEFGDFISTNKIIHVTDNAHKRDMGKLIDTLENMSNERYSLSLFEIFLY